MPHILTAPGRANSLQNNKQISRHGAGENKGQMDRAAVLAKLVSWRVPLRLSALCLPCRGIADKRNNCAQKPLESGLGLGQNLSLSSLLNAKLNTLARLNVDKSRQRRLLRDCAIHCSTWRGRSTT